MQGQITSSLFAEKDKGADLRHIRICLYSGKIWGTGHDREFMRRRPLSRSEELLSRSEKLLSRSEDLFWVSEDFV